jgi:hypothetical protein
MSPRRVRHMSELGAKAAHFAKMEKVAECIIRPVPQWLPKVLSKWSFDVRSQHSIDHVWPTRKQMSDSLIRGRLLAIELQDVLRSSGVAGFLATNSKLESEEQLLNVITGHIKWSGYHTDPKTGNLRVVTGILRDQTSPFSVRPRLTQQSGQGG